MDIRGCGFAEFSIQPYVPSFATFLRHLSLFLHFHPSVERQPKCRPFMGLTWSRRPGGSSGRLIDTSPCRLIDPNSIADSPSLVPSCSSQATSHHRHERPSPSILSAPMSRNLLRSTRMLFSSSPGYHIFTKMGPAAILLSRSSLQRTPVQDTTVLLSPVLAPQAPLHRKVSLLSLQLCDLT